MKTFSVMGVSLDAASLKVVVGFILANAIAHLLLATRYGYHGDELYFIECGRHLAFGYVDHAPMIPWLARAAEELAGGTNLVMLRAPAIAASCGTLAAIALLTAKWGGGVRAQLIALLSFLFAPAHLRLASMLDIPVVEVFLCAAATFQTSRAVERRRHVDWLVLGAILGLALLTKHTVLLWVAGLVLGVLATPQRRVFATPGPWLAAVVAAALFAPNVLWQHRHDYATLQFAAGLRRDVVLDHGRLLFVLGQLLYFHPLTPLVWGCGFVFGLRSDERVRPFAVQFAFLFAAWLVLGGKPYYLASAYPAVLAAGGVVLERRLEANRWAFRTLWLSLGGVGLALALLTLPILDVRTIDRAIGRVLGWIIPPMALTHDLHGELGWDAHVRAVENVLASLSPSERETAAVLTRSYAQAAALNVLRTNSKPRAVSGHMNYYLWGPEPGRGQVLVAYGLPRALLLRHYRSVEERGRIDAPLARPGDTDLPVYVCRERLSAPGDFWPALRRFDHRIVLRD
jgi:hypothetical protein